LVLLIAIALALAGSDVPFTTLARGTSSNIDEPRQAVVRTEGEWQALWKEHGEKPAAPRVEFAGKMVVGVFAGTRPTAGIEVEIVRARLDGAALVIEYRERRPGPGTVVAQILTFPFHLVSIAKHDGPVRFERVDAR
jgi:hypothetical protein